VRHLLLVTTLMAGAGCGDERVPPSAQTCVDLDGVTGVDNEGWVHKTDPADHVYAANPPASGPHYPVWASWGVHDDVVERGLWVHNVEHGGVVLLIGPSASADAEAALRQAFEDTDADPACGHNRILLTRDPELDDAVAAVAADRVLVPGPFDNGVLSSDRVVEFVLACRGLAPEDVCS
jgi:hypothetical protein